MKQSIFILPFLAGMLISVLGAAAWSLGQARAECPQPIIVVTATPTP